MTKTLICIALLVVVLLAGFFIGRYTKPPEVVEIEIPAELLSEHQISALSQKLDTDTPLETLRNDLVSKPELIPFEAQLGGEMGFYETERIIVLNEKWVYAPFEDGHIGGYALLGYEIDEKGNIVWEIVEAVLY